MNNKLVIVLSAATILVGSIVFGYFVVDAKKIDREKYAEKKIKVASYAAFVSHFGPGPELAKRFKEKTGYKVELVNGGDATLIVNRLLADKKMNLDVVVGIDQMLASQAMQLKWKPLSEGLKNRVRSDLLVFGETPFLPIDWSPLTFIFKSENETGQSKLYPALADFYSENHEGKKLALQDPRSTTLGQQWLYWYTQKNFGADLASQIPTKVASSWSQAYGQFKRGSVDYVFSYLTSLAFHWGQEKDRSYSFYSFENGHPFQVNAAGVLDRCKECDMARQFLEFLLEPGSQALIMQKDYMFPASKDMKPSGLFAELPDLKLISYENKNEFEQVKAKKQDLYLKSLDK